MEEENKIRSQVLLRPEHRKPYQTTEFIYKALSVAEEQVKELLEEIDILKNKNK